MMLAPFPAIVPPMFLIKSKKRVADHGKVFTSQWTVDVMLDLVKDEKRRIDLRFLEPARGSGNFMVLTLRSKLSVFEVKYGHWPFEIGA
jgi:hypothetical protein